LRKLVLGIPAQASGKNLTGRQNVDVAGYDNDQAGRDLAVRDQRDDAGILINGLAIDDASRGFEGVAKWHVRRTSGAPKALAVALSFCCLLGLGCPKLVIRGS
jgi:hypothetical protein